MRINLTLHQLHCFLRVAETGNFSEAARGLGLSQPALSRTIRMVETVLQTRLFDRDTRNVALTPAGEELRVTAQRLVLEFDGALGEVAQFVAGQRGCVVIAALPSLAAVVLPPVIAAFRRDWPQVQIVIKDGLSGSVVDHVLDGRADIGLTVRPSPSENLTYQSIAQDLFGLVCRDDDPLARVASHDWSVFTQYPFIAMAQGSSVRAYTDAAFLQIGQPVPQLYECSFLGTAGHLIASGLGISALPQMTLPLIAAQRLVWRPLSGPVIHREIGTLRRTGRALAPAAEHFLKALSATPKALAL